MEHSEKHRGEKLGNHLCSPKANGLLIVKISWQVLSMWFFLLGPTMATVKCKQLTSNFYPNLFIDYLTQRFRNIENIPGELYNVDLDNNWT